VGGFGLIQVPRTGMQPHLDTGELVTVLPQFTAPAMGVILYARQRHLPLRVRVFMEWLGRSSARRSDDRCGTRDLLILLEKQDQKIAACQLLQGFGDQKIG
jgi:hypothetical protein